MKRLKLLLLFLLFTTTYTQAQWEVQLDNNNFTHLDRIFFLDENYGWTIGGATIGDVSPYFYTTNGGEQWYLCDDWMNRMGTDICFVNQDTGFIAASEGIIRKTTNGGQTWTNIQTLATQHVQRLFFVDDNNGWATLDNQTDDFQLLHTTNGGNNWETQQVFTLNTSGLHSLYFLNDSIGYGGGGYFDVENDDSYSNIVKTTNKGDTWENIYLSQNSFYSIDDIFFINNLIGFAVGCKNSINTHLILYTEDGGEDWDEHYLPDLENWYGQTRTASIIYSIEFANDTLGWLTCADEYGSGYVLLTTNGGETWQQQYVNRNLNVPIYDICAVDENNVWAVGGDYIYHNNNADTIIIPAKVENIKRDSIRISPNPTTGIFTINLPNEISTAQINISDITGKEIISTNQYSKIDITKQPQGIYFITLKLNNQIIQTQKIIKL